MYIGLERTSQAAADAITVSHSLFELDLSPAMSTPTGMLTQTPMSSLAALR